MQESFAVCRADVIMQLRFAVMAVSAKWHALLVASLSNAQI